VSPSIENRAREKRVKSRAQIDANFISNIFGKETADESVWFRLDDPLLQHPLGRKLPDKTSPVDVTSS
jgi:hypothetical protein